MKSRERVLAAIHCQPVDRTPWVPFVGCHAGALIGKSAREILSSTDLVVAGANEAIRRYQPDGIPVVFDLQIEAEALGCSLNWSEDNPPAVVSHPLVEGKTLADLQIPALTAGRIAMAMEATRKLRASHPDIALYGLITGPFTLALHLLGTEIFMEMFDNPEHVHAVMDFCRQVGQQLADGYIEAGADVVALVDPMTSQIGPEQFVEFVTPYAAPLFQHIRDKGRLGSFFVCGHAQRNIEVMCGCRPDNVSVDENIPLEYVRDICLAQGISFGGNMQLTTVLLLGSETDAQKNALACLRIGGDKGYLLAPGCDLPFATPPANLEAVTCLVLDPYQQEVVGALAQDETPETILDMSQYGQSDKVVVDIITLDSEACAPCQYMVESVKAIAPEFEGIVIWREHKIKYRESLVFMTSLMVRNIPTICIDGQITFVSRIPKKDELIAAIQNRIFEKLKIKIQRKRGEFLILGDGGEECQQVATVLQQAAVELGSDVEVRMITDENAVYSYGLSPGQTPAVVMARYQVKSARRVPEVNVAKEWIKLIL
jgi:uroporphyrinogen decarboxylase